MDLLTLGGQDYILSDYGKVVKEITKKIDQYTSGDKTMKMLAEKIGVTYQTVLNCVNFEKQVVKDLRLTGIAKEIGLDLIILVKDGKKFYYLK